jgi:hypothetical protein
VRILRPETTGFPASKAESFKKTPGYKDRVKLSLWTKKGLEEVKAGYPYLPKPDEQDKSQIQSPIKGPQIVSKLSDGRFSSRAATTFEFEERTYCLILAIDGNRRALEKYEQLGRKGHKKYGIRLTDQRGTFICSEGVKICQFNQLFEHSQLQDYAVLEVVGRSTIFL